MNIYITPTNEEKLRKEPSMSGLVNTLLQWHYEQKINIKDGPQTKTTKQVKKEYDSLLEDPNIKLATDAFNGETCQGHAMKWDCGLPGCKYGSY